MKKALVYVLPMIVLLNNFLYGYGSEQHKMLSNAAIHVSLKQSRYLKLYKFLLENNLIDYIVQNSSKPDSEPLTDEEIRNNCELNTYNFKGFIDSKLDYIINRVFNESAFFSDVISNQTKQFVAEELSSVSSESVNMTNEQKLRAATQHTYVAHPGKTTHEVAILFGEITIAPYAAQAEYNMAVSALNGKQFSQATNDERSEALKRLGRTLHYIQDITVPHHCEIGGNYWDLYYGLYTGNINNSSQTAYENNYIRDNYYFDSANKKFIRIGENQEVYKNIKWIFDWDKLYRKEVGPGMYKSVHLYEWEENGYYENNPLKFERDLINISIKDLIITLRNDIIDHTYMDFCDGVQRYSTYHKVACSTLGGIIGGITWGKLYADILPAHFEHCYDEPNVCVPNWTLTGYTWTTFRTVNDNFKYVSDNLLPGAITNSAKIIAKFFHETQGFNKDIDIAPILNLILE